MPETPFLADASEPDLAQGRYFGGRSKAWLILPLLALVLGLVWLLKARVWSQVPSLEGTIQTWVDAEKKEGLAKYLKAQVLAPDFAAQVKRVAKGQNYWSLARGAKVNIDSVVGFNPDMEHLNAYVGRPVLVPSRSGALHQVLAGESVSSIEKDYALEPGELAKANRIGWLGVRPGQVLFVPGARPRQLTGPMQVLFEKRSFFRSPLAGKYTSLLGTRTDPFTGDYKVHNGVDIKAPFNSLVAASAAGRVTLAGWNGGYGKCVVIEHSNGYRTLYGHLNTVLVKQGAVVKQNQYIGRVGMTGRTTGAHLHFTIWKDGKLQNPLKYLW